MGGTRAALVAPVLALAILVAAVGAAVPSPGVEKCGGCTPCVGADCPVPALPPPPPYFYYNPPPPASYYPGAGAGSGGCPPPPGAYIQIGSTPPGKGPLYPQDPGFMPSAAPRRAVAAFAAAVAAMLVVAFL
ncbi:hypothetical protein PR202_gb05382 [Eleusine coracana subsp. coracana]|uniref:4Fe-4S ferredoxin-type domain-containing protein n=1 Tax=Eleusine coracana subsp. coracana TaxID=191504 RepID=A0AAV5E618_ELECO|nr:hypothetical protein QOZ80_1BG0076710 [Eleusine coracana subsp. coracana]GJN18242.1 hypothetical protein PR202_gb05382 [Eleusine coracana subsp. coracana]